MICGRKYFRGQKLFVDRTKGACARLRRMDWSAPTEIKETRNSSRLMLTYVGRRANYTSRLTLELNSENYFNLFTINYLKFPIQKKDPQPIRLRAFET